MRRCLVSAPWLSALASGAAGGAPHDPSRSNPRRSSGSSSSAASRAGLNRADEISDPTLGLTSETAVCRAEATSCHGSAPQWRPEHRAGYSRILAGVTRAPSECPEAWSASHGGMSEVFGLASDAGRADADHSLGRRSHPPHSRHYLAGAGGRGTMRRPPPPTKRSSVSARSQRGTSTSTSSAFRSFANASRPDSRPRTASTRTGSR